MHQLLAKVACSGLHVDYLPMPHYIRKNQPLLTVLCCFALLPLQLSAQEQATYDTQALTQTLETSISVSGRTVRVQHAQGAVLEVYSVTGRAVARVAIETADQSVSLNLPKGCYVLRVGTLTHKVYLP